MKRPGTRTAGVLASLALCMLLPSLATSIANVALPTLSAVLGASFQQVQWVVLAYLLATTTLIVGIGRLGDLFGRRRLLLMGIALFTLASALCGVAAGLLLLIAARVVQGMAAAIMLALGLALVAEVIAKDRIGRAMGVLGAVSAIGTALGPSLGGLLIAGFGWRAIFLINLPLGFVALALAWRHLPTDRKVADPDGRRIDAAGTLLLALTLAAYALAMTVGRGSFGIANVALLVAAALGLCLLIRVESRTVSPLLDLYSLRDPRLGSGLATSALVAAVMMATLIVGPFHLSGALGLTTAQVGLVMSAGPIVAALIGVPAGRLVDRMGAHRMAAGGLAGMVLGCATLSLASISLGIVGYVLPSVLLTGSYALFQTANNTAVMQQVSAARRGVVAGLLNLSRNLGLITGAAVLGAVFAFASRGDDPASGLQVTFAVAAVMVLAGLAISLRGAVLPDSTQASQEGEQP